MQNKIHKPKRHVVTSRTHGSLREHPRVEVSAGGIVFTRSARGIFFAMLKDSYGKWTFPKGHVMRGEKYEEAARREVGEEMGIHNITLHKPLGHIDIWFRDRFVFKGKLIHKYIHYYLFEAKQNVRLEKPEIVEGGERIQAVAWVEGQEVVKRSNYKDMRPILNRAFESLAIPVRAGGQPPKAGVRPQGQIVRPVVQPSPRPQGQSPRPRPNPQQDRGRQNRKYRPK